MTVKDLFGNTQTFILIGGLIGTLAVTQFQVQAHASDINTIQTELKSTQLEQAQNRIQLSTLDRSQDEFKDTLSEVNKTLNSVNSTLSGLQATIKSLDKR